MSNSSFIIKRKIVIYRGLFDPLHNAHKAIIAELYNRFDEIYIVPAKHKLNMMFSDNARLSFINDFVNKCYPNLNKIHVINDELKDETDELSKMFNLVNHIRSKYLNKDLENEIYLSIGLDEYENLKNWYKYEDLLKIVKLIVFNRGELKFNRLLEDADTDIMTLEIHGFENISSTKIRNEIYNYIILN